MLCGVANLFFALAGLESNLIVILVTNTDFADDSKLLKKAVTTVTVKLHKLSMACNYCCLNPG